MSDIFSPRIGARHQDGALALRAHRPICGGPVKKKWTKSAQKGENLLALQTLAKANDFMPAPSWMRVSPMVGNNMKTECVTAVHRRASLSGSDTFRKIGTD